MSRCEGLPPFQRFFVGRVVAIARHLTSHILPRLVWQLELCCHQARRWRSRLAGTREAFVQIAYTNNFGVWFYRLKTMWLREIANPLHTGGVASSILAAPTIYQ